MTAEKPRTIWIAAALIEDGEGRLLLVRKAGTEWFMQAGGKIEDGESPLAALRRELSEEIGLVLGEHDARHVGCYFAPAANEPDHTVKAEVFHVRVQYEPVTRLEIEEALWVDPGTAAAMPLAPLTRDFILPLARALSAEDRLRAVVAGSPILTTILDRWSSMNLPDCWLSGTAIAQTAWNAAFGLSPEYGIADIDLVYFDASDLSEQGEARRAARVRDLFPDVPLWIDAKNEARVHLWYESKFGYPIEAYQSSGQAISTFPTTAGAVAIRPNGRSLSIFAPFGLSDLLNCTVRPNKAQITQAIYEAKIARWRDCWPELTIIGWEEG
jgi:8-oxo-dGTP pyrophosphatase MutT (NUDIX family)